MRSRLALRLVWFTRRRLSRLARVSKGSGRRRVGDVLTGGAAGDERSALIGAPIKVVVVDVERLPLEILAEHPDGGRYQGRGLLTRVGGEPRSVIKLRFAGDRIARADLAPHFRELTADGRVATGLMLPESLRRYR